MVSAVAFGIGSTVANVSDKSLAFETSRVPISLKAYDPVTDKIIFKAQIPDDYIGKISEIGLYSQFTDTITDMSSQIIASLSSEEEWTAVSGTFSSNSTNTRYGPNSIRMSLASSGSAKVSLPVSLDLSSYSSNDAVRVAYNASSANIASISVEFKTDAGNYYTGSFVPASGYLIGSILKSAFTPTGNPSWSDINSIEIGATATSGGAVNVDLDAIGFFDQDYLNPDLVLVSRDIISAITKVENSVNEVEISLGVTV